MSQNPPNPTITYRCAEPGELPTLSLLKGKMKREAAAPGEWVRRWPWQFVAHPWRRPACASNFVVALLDGRIAAGIGFLPTVLEVDGRRIESAFGCELFVDPDAQGHGLGQALIDRVVELYPDSLWMNTPPAGARSYQKRGFSVVEPVNYRMLPVNPGRVLGARGHRLLGALAGWTGAVVRPMVRLRARSRKLPAGLVLEDVRDPGPGFDRLHEATALPGIVRPRRDAAFLRWRYRECPFGPYRLIAARSGGELAGFTAFRTKPSHNGTLGIVNEIVADPRHAGLAGALLGAAMRGLLDAGADLVMALPTDPASLAVFTRAGFLDARRTPYLYVAPGAAARLGLPADGARWSLGMGDSDVDYF